MVGKQLYLFIFPGRTNHPSTLIGADTISIIFLLKAKVLGNFILIKGEEQILQPGSTLRIVSPPTMHFWWRQ